MNTCLIIFVCFDLIGLFTCVDRYNTVLFNTDGRQFYTYFCTSERFPLVMEEVLFLMSILQYITTEEFLQML